VPLAVLGAAVGAIWVSAWSGAASATFGDPPAARPAGGSGRKNILPARAQAGSGLKADGVPHQRWRLARALAF